MSSLAVFQGDGELYRADTCAPLRAAAGAGLVRLEAVAHGHYPGRRMSPKMLPQLRSAGYWDAPAQQNWGLDWHRNEGIELTYLARGQLDFAVDDRTFTLKRGHLTITRPWQRHRVGTPDVAASHLLWVILDVGVRRPNQTWIWPPWVILSAAEQRCLTSMLSHNEQPVWPADQQVAACFERLGGVVDASPTRGAGTLLALLVNELLLALMQMLRQKNIPLDQTLTSAQRSVEMFLAELRQRVDQPWTVDDMAESCGLGRSRFTQYCRQITNASPMEYLNRCRVERARALLSQSPGMTITQVAGACGFASSQYFATVFRQITGQTPRAARTAL